MDGAEYGRYDDQFVIATFDNAPTADSELYGKLEKTIRDAHESQVRCVRWHGFGDVLKTFYSLVYK